MGTVSGSVLLIDMSTGDMVMSSSVSDHMDTVTAIGSSAHLQHCVTGSRDRSIKVGPNSPQRGMCVLYI